ncbi:hypothetical protein OH77DRAFT_1429511, partial [Trametes cingulata]
MPPLPTTALPPSPAARRIITRIIHGWHSASIRLAGRIWGTYKRRTSPRPPAASPAEAISLPSHLAYLL